MSGANACMVLNSYHQGCNYELVSETGPPHKKEYVMGVAILGSKYLGKGRSKKEAKQAAAANALESIYHLRLSLGTGAAGGPNEMDLVRVYALHELLFLFARAHRGVEAGLLH